MLLGALETGPMHGGGRRRWSVRGRLTRAILNRQEITSVLLISLLLL